MSKKQAKNMKRDRTMNNWLLYRHQASTFIWSIFIFLGWWLFCQTKTLRYKLWLHTWRNWAKSSRWTCAISGRPQATSFTPRWLFFQSVCFWKWRDSSIMFYWGSKGKNKSSVIWGAISSHRCPRSLVKETKSGLYHCRQWSLHWLHLHLVFDTKHCVRLSWRVACTLLYDSSFHSSVE